MTISIVITPTVLLPATITNTVQISSTAPPPELNWADNQITQTTQIALPLADSQIGRCWLTEYFDTPQTPQGNFRIFYTRTFPNKKGWNEEKDCRVLPPDQSNNPPPLDASGYPSFVTILGASLEKSLSQYGQMNYPTANIPKDANGHYLVYVSSDPIWTDNSIVNMTDISKVLGVTLPDHMFIRHTVQYTSTQTVPIDPLRAEVGAHELFHAVQWTYVPSGCPLGGQLCTYGTQSDLRWWMEATARWAEPKVYPQSGTYPGSIDALLSQPYVSMPETAGYSSAIFARYLEDKVAGGSPDIIRQTWQQYGSDSSDGMVHAIDQVLQRQDYPYHTSLAEEFPKFTWNNYFMITGTYDSQVTNVYTNLATLPPPFTGPEWQLFRTWLFQDRAKWQDGNAGVFVDKVDQFPSNQFDGPAPGRPFVVNNLGAAYIEFYPIALPANRAADLTITLSLQAVPGNPAPKVSVIPIANFAATPPNNFVQPTIQLEGTVALYTYSQTIQDFQNLNRVAVIISNVDTIYNPVSFSYHAEVTLH